MDRPQHRSLHGSLTSNLTSRKLNRATHFIFCTVNILNTKMSDKMEYANSADPDQTASEGSTLFAVTLSKETTA